MKKVYVVYSVVRGEIGKSIKVFDFEYHAVKYASEHNLKIIEKTLIQK
jgi:hypothetical protein